jgi:rubredoxin
LFALNDYQKRKWRNAMAKWECSACGYVYDPAVGDPENGEEPNTAFEALPDSWFCPNCGVGKEFFEKQE